MKCTQKMYMIGVDYVPTGHSIWASCVDDWNCIAFTGICHFWCIWGYNPLKLSLVVLKRWDYDHVFGLHNPSLCMFLFCKFIWMNFFMGSVWRRETIYWLFCYKSKFSNHFAFTFECYLFSLFLVQRRDECSGLLVELIQGKWSAIVVVFQKKR